jgi:hypothetical protein
MPAKYPAIPSPQADLVALRTTGDALKETVEMLTLQRGSPLQGAVTWQDLIDLGLILPTQVPR